MARQPKADVEQASVAAKTITLHLNSMHLVLANITFESAATTDPPDQAQ